jgi:hypothetical protein
MLNLNYNVIGSQRDRTVRNPPPFPFGNFPIELQVVGGGGAGGFDIGGGGGAGGVRYVPTYIIDDQYSYSVIIGPGHDGIFQDPWISDPPTISNASGSNSYFINNTTLETITAFGGGNAGSGSNAKGNRGASGGGGSGFSAIGGAKLGAFNTGSDGGASGPEVNKGGGGGGGAAESGSFGGLGGAGGAGIPILGFNSGSIKIAGGGSAQGPGGEGGGGDGGVFVSPDSPSNVPVKRGTPNTGGGGGGINGIPTTAFTSSYNTGGGSGLVVIFYKGIQQAIGGQVETRELNDGFYTQHIFTASGQFEPIAS